MIWLASQRIPIPPWEFDSGSGDDVRHLWFNLIQVAAAAEAGAQQMQVDYEKRMQHRVG